MTKSQKLDRLFPNIEYTEMMLTGEMEFCNFMKDAMDHMEIIAEPRSTNSEYHYTFYWGQKSIFNTIVEILKKMNSKIVADFDERNEQILKDKLFRWEMRKYLTDRLTKIDVHIRSTKGEFIYTPSVNESKLSSALPVFLQAKSGRIDQLDMLGTWYGIDEVERIKLFFQHSGHQDFLNMEITQINHGILCLKRK